MIREETIYFDIKASTKQSVLEFIALKALELGVCSQQQGLLSDLLEREQSYSTGLADRFAIPHARSQYVTTPTIIYIRLKEVVEWETLDDENVQYVFALLVPYENEGNLHLKMLSNLATCLLDDEFKEKVRMSNDKTKLKEYIKEKMEESL